MDPNWKNHFAASRTISNSYNFQDSFSLHVNSINGGNRQIQSTQSLFHSPWLKPLITPSVMLNITHLGALLAFPDTLVHIFLMDAQSKTRLNTVANRQNSTS